MRNIDLDGFTVYLCPYCQSENFIESAKSLFRECEKGKYYCNNCNNYFFNRDILKIVEVANADRKYVPVKYNGEMLDCYDMSDLNSAIERGKEIYNQKHSIKSKQQFKTKIKNFISNLEDFIRSLYYGIMLTILGFFMMYMFLFFVYCITFLILEIPYHLSLFITIFAIPIVLYITIRFFKENIEVG